MWFGIEKWSSTSGFSKLFIGRLKSLFVVSYCKATVLVVGGSSVAPGFV
jgi:hypothetical protein